MGALEALNKIAKIAAVIVMIISGSGCGPAAKQYFTRLSSSPLSSQQQGGAPTDSPSGTPTGIPTGTPTPTPTSTPTSSPTPNPTPTPTQTVCVPFGNSDNLPSDSEVGHGLIAQLKYLSNDMPRYSSVGDYQRNGIPLDAALYFFNVNTPTRSFTNGFAAQDGNPLTLPDGTVLIEYFSLHFESQLRLPAGQAEKKYQFALLSDDGVVLQMDSDTGYQTVINDDSVHATKMSCSSSPVTLSSAQGLPMKLDYFQGPRTEIALVFMFREWTDDTSFDPRDPLCGANGNDLFFNDRTVPSQTQQPYLDLLSRGWRVVPSEYFYLPGNPPPPNPCQ